MNSKEYLVSLLKEFGYTGNKTELRREYKNLHVVIKPQKSRFGEEVFLNFGIIYKDLMKKRTPKLSECQMEFRFRQLLMALKKEEFDIGIDDCFYLPQFADQFKDNLNNDLEKLILEFDDLERMKDRFPKNIPKLKSDEIDEDYIEVIYYFNAEKELKELFNKSKTTC
jgi:hypothetical protein